VINTSEFRAILASVETLTRGLSFCPERVYVPARRRVEHAAVLPAELGRTLVADAERGLGRSPYPSFVRRQWPAWGMGARGRKPVPDTGGRRNFCKHLRGCSRWRRPRAIPPPLGCTRLPWRPTFGYLLFVPKRTTFGGTVCRDATSQ
jgi:hypothetical protein